MESRWCTKHATPISWPLSMNADLRGDLITENKEKNIIQIYLSKYIIHSSANNNNWSSKKRVSWAQNRKQWSWDITAQLFCFYSKHHTAERWNSEFGSNTTEKFENSREKMKNHEAQKLDFSDESFWQWKNYFSFIFYSIKTIHKILIEMCLRQNRQNLQNSICWFDYFIDNHITILSTTIWIRWDHISKEIQQDLQNQTSFLRFQNFTGASYPTR